MRVLVADKFESSGRKGLEDAGCEVVYEPDLKGDALTEAVARTQADVLVVRSTQVNRATLEKGRLSLVVRAGAGFNTIDVEAASQRGIWVSNCPGKNAIAVAELAMGLLLAQDRRIVEGSTDLRAGKWNKKEYSKARGVFGRTLGLLGCGNIGREVALRAMAFGMHVCGWSPLFDEEGAAEIGIEKKVSPIEVAKSSDVISIHLAMRPETKRLVDEAFLSAMRPGALLVNTARAEIVDQHSLERAVAGGHIRAAVDVFAEEPEGGAGDVKSALFELPGVIGTHHIGASTDQAQEAIADETVRIVRVYKETGRAPNVVNLARKSPATHVLVIRHYDRVGVLAGVFDGLKRAGINVQETENIVFDGAHAAVARVHTSSAPSAEVMESIRADANVIEAGVVTL
ncbi:MAG TPA: NAD(P)-dependent oxidoreductase [Polyangiaceae bacterium]|nr:NAD(P)-dependent oxidoreductase [Polyangiaceae bacterium]